MKQRTETPPDLLGRNRGWPDRVADALFFVGVVAGAMTLMGIIPVAWGGGLFLTGMVAVALTDEWIMLMVVMLAIVIVTPIIQIRNHFKDDHEK